MQPDMKRAPGESFPATTQTRNTTSSGEPAGTHHTTEMDPVQRAALDRVYSWLFAPLPVEGEHESEDAA